MIRNRIREYRARYGMSQEDLAKLAGVRRETIGNLEKGKYNPSLVLAWNKCFRCPLRRSSQWRTSALSVWHVPGCIILRRLWFCATLICKFC